MYIFSATQCIHIIVRRQTGRQACMRRLLCLMVDRRAEQERKNQASMSLLLFSCSRQLMAASKVVARVLKMARESGTISGTIQMKLVCLLLIVLLSLRFRYTTLVRSTTTSAMEQQQMGIDSSRAQKPRDLQYCITTAMQLFLVSLFRSHLCTEQKRELSS